MMKPTMRSGKFLFTGLLAVGFGLSCATKTPVVIVCEPTDEKLIQPLTFCPPADNLGSLEDCLVDFVHRALPADNARKTELLRQLEILKQRRE